MSGIDDPGAYISFVGSSLLLPEVIGAVGQVMAVTAAVVGSVQAYRFRGRRGKPFVTGEPKLLD